MLILCHLLFFDIYTWNGFSASWVIYRHKNLEVVSAAVMIPIYACYLAYVYIFSIVGIQVTRKSDNKLFIILIRSFGVIDNHRETKTVHVLTSIVTMDPIGTILSNVELILKRITRRNSTIKELLGK